MKTTTRQTLKIFWQHSRKYPWAIFAMVAGMVGGVAIQTYIPIWYKRFFDLLSLGDAGNAERLFEIIFIVLGLKFVNWMFMRVATFTNNFFQPRVMADLLDTCFTYLQHHSYNFFNNRFVGRLVGRVNRN